LVLKPFTVVILYLREGRFNSAYSIRPIAVLDGRMTDEVKSIWKEVDMTRSLNFFNLHNPSGCTRPWGLLSF
jgi:hypothetical protein